MESYPSSSTELPQHLPPKEGTKVQGLPPHLTVRQVADRLGLSCGSANRWCYKCNYPAHRQPPRAKNVLRLKILRALPPDLTIPEVARRLKSTCSVAKYLIQVAQYHFRHSVPAHYKVPRAKWRTVNWSQSNVAIAKKMHVTASRVGQIRQREGVPLISKAMAREARKKQMDALPRGLSVPEIAARLQVSPITVLQYCRRFGYCPRNQYDDLHERRKLQFQNIVPGLRIGELARQLGVAPLTARRWASLLGYSLPSCKQVPASVRSIREIIVEKFQNLPPGLSVGQIAKRLDRPEWIIKRWCRIFGYQLPTRPALRGL